MLNPALYPAIFVRKSIRKYDETKPLSAEQLAYAASDVLYLHALWARLEGLLIREGRLELAEACFAFLPTRGRLDVLGWEEPDIFHH